MTNVVKFDPVIVGENFRFDGDEILEAAKGRQWSRLMIIGEIEGEDDLYIAGNANAGETLILMEMAKRDLIP